GVLRRAPAAVAAVPAPEPEFREIFASAPDGMVLLDGERIVAANPSLEALSGAQAQSLDGQDVALLFAEPAEGEDTLARLFSRPVAASVPIHEASLRKQDSASPRVEVSGFPFPWRGRVLRVLQIRDITERKSREEARLRAEAALRKSEGGLRAVVTHSPVAFFAFDKDGNFTLAEGKALEPMGLRKADLEGQSAFAKAGRLRPMLGALRRALDGKAVDETFEVGGSWFEVRLRPLAGPDGRPDGAMGLALDVTELRRAEEELRRSKEQMRTVVAGAPIILFALDKKGTYTLTEGRGLEAMGLKPGEHLGKSVFDIHRANPQMALNVRRALSGESFTSVVQIGPQWFETHYSPVFEGYDEVTGVIGVAINVTDRKGAEDALRRSEEQLRHSRKMEAIGRVAGGVAHDFNNLLTAITGYTELLLVDAGQDGGEGQDSEGTRKSLEEIRKAAERATALTRQLLAFSRKQVLSPKVLGLNQVVGDMDKMLRRLIPENIELVSILAPALGEVYVDPGQMEQVILNLALNARDAMPKGGQLTLETANVDLDAHTARGELFLVPGPYVLLSVSDTGIGMDDQVKAHLFEPFFTTKEEGKGLGLGLSAVYGIVKQSGGTIQVESEKGKGTTLKVYLPRAEKGASMRRPPRPVESLHGEETVLLVEDEEAVRTLIREILAMHGYRVLEARSGGEAILVSQRHDGPLHLLLTDVVMANMSGQELADHLRPLRPEMKVLYISGHSEDTVFGDAGGMKPGPSADIRGSAAFLAKPFTPKTLALKVREVLESKSSPKGLVHRA
ncbi:MAG TPA: PAS domain S-box protein, partial [Fibrobacteria bacterium]|nr:PAS domain S-box protein [Fibrobacteria bacterium]